MEQLRARIVTEHIALVQQLEIMYMNRINALLRMKSFIHTKLQISCYEKLKEIDQIIAKSASSSIETSSISYPKNETDSVQSVDRTLNEPINILHPTPLNFNLGNNENDRSNKLQQSGYRKSDKKKKEKKREKKAEKKAEKKIFECNYCNYSGSSKWNLSSHIKNNHQEKRWKCDVCHKRFGQNHLLKRHSFIHSGEKPYNCNVCGKQFGRKDYLMQHKKTHK